MHLDGVIAPARYLGNTEFVHWSKSKLKLADLCGVIHKEFHKPFRDPKTVKEAAEPLLRRVARIECGADPCGELVMCAVRETLKTMSPLLAYHSLFSDPIRSVDFGAGELIGLAPFSREDSILIVPAADGAKVYVNPHTWMLGFEDDPWLQILQLLESKQFKDCILAL